MDTDKIPTAIPAPWQPITDPIQIAVLGKLGEELNELGAAVSRALIQGVDGIDPDTDRANRRLIADEIADVEAMILHTRMLLEVPNYQTAGRRDRKFEFIRKWLLTFDTATPAVVRAHSP